MSSTLQEEVKQRTRSFLARFLRNAEVQDTDDLFASGLVNSLFAMQLVLFVEKEFGVTVAHEDLDLSNFRSLAAIAAFIEHKKAA